MNELYNKIIANENEKNKEEVQKNEKQEIIKISVELLDEFEKHIFSQIADNKYIELKESIARNGLLSPIIVRRKNDRYEIIAGHNRVRCFKDLKLNEVPAIVKDYDDDTAELIMIESNLSQREKIPFSEKGLAYKIKLEILKKIKKENKDNPYSNKETKGLDQVGQVKSSVEELSQNSDDSESQIKRFIRLTELNDELKNKIDMEELPMLVGVELSYINKEEQDVINKFIEDKEMKISIAQAQKLRAVAGNIKVDNIFDIINSKKKKEVKFTGKINKEIIKRYKDKFENDKEFNDLIEELLKNYYQNLTD